MAELLRGAGYAPHVEILYGEQVVQLPVDDGSTAELERIQSDLIEMAPRVLKAAAAGDGAVGGSAGDALRAWIVQEFNAKRELLHLHRPVSGHCGACLAGDRGDGQFPGPAAWPCRTVDELIAPLRVVGAVTDEPREPTRPALVADLLAEIEALAESTRLQAKSLEILSSLVAERRRVWMVMAGGRHGTLVGGPYGSGEDAEAAREALIEEATADGSWGRLHPDVASAWELYQVHEYEIAYPLGWASE